MDLRRYARAAVAASLLSLVPSLAMAERRGVRGCDLEEICEPTDPTAPDPGLPPSPDLPPEDPPYVPPVTPPDIPPGTPPSEPPADPSSPFVPDSSTIVDLYPFISMNWESLPHQIHTEGWWNCPSGYDAEWCPTDFDGIPRRGGFHKYYTRESPREGCGAEIVFTKSPNNDWGMEIHCATGERVDILEENLGERWRNFVKRDGFTPGTTWVDRNTLNGRYTLGEGKQRFRTCAEPEQVLEEHPVHFTYALYGPYAVDTPEGLYAAERDLWAFVPPGQPVVEPAWLVMASQIALPGDHVWFVLRDDHWGLLPQRPLDADPANWGHREVYRYVGTGPRPDYLRGMGMTGWGSHSKEDDRWVRQAVLDTLVVEQSPRMYADICPATTSNATASSVPDAVPEQYLPRGSGPLTYR